MTLEEKRQVIEKNKSIAVTAINSYLDSIYGLTDKFFDEEGNLRDGLESDPKVEEFIKSTRKETGPYEKVREKLIAGDFNLSLLEVNRVGLSFLFCATRMDKDIKAITAAHDQLMDLVSQLVSKENENVDFSKEE